MRYFEFGGGAGDVINDIYRYDSYAAIQGMPTGSHAKVGLITHNPSVKELFQFLPGGHLLEVHDYGYWQPEEDAGYRAANAMPPKPKDKPRPEWARFSFYNHPKDEEVLKELPDEYVVFSVSAGTSDRNVPARIVDRILGDMTELDVPFDVAVGRKYERNGKVEVYVPASLNLINRLSLPATLNVVRDSRCKGVVCCHSAVSLFAGWENKPQLLLYNEETQKRHFRKKDQWSWYAFDRPENTIHGTFYQWEEKSEQFFNRIQCSTATT